MSKGPVALDLARVPVSDAGTRSTNCDLAAGGCVNSMGDLVDTVMRYRVRGSSSVLVEIDADTCGVEEVSRTTEGVLEAGQRLGSALGGVRDAAQAALSTLSPETVEMEFGIKLAGRGGSADREDQRRGSLHDEAVATTTACPGRLGRHGRAQIVPVGGYVDAELEDRSWPRAYVTWQHRYRFRFPSTCLRADRGGRQNRSGTEMPCSPRPAGRLTTAYGSWPILRPRRTGGRRFRGCAQPGRSGSRHRQSPRLANKIRNFMPEIDLAVADSSVDVAVDGHVAG
jgi:hypothetical protein